MRPASGRVFLHQSFPGRDLSPGGHGGAAIPVPIPNTEVKRAIGEGTAAVGRGRVARRRGLFFAG